MLRFRCVAALLVAALAINVPAHGQQRRLGADDGDNAGAFRGQPGRRITYVCPAKVSIVEMLWGTNDYADTSRICLAALHAGVLQRNQAGIVTVIFSGPIESFRGSEQYNIASRSAPREETSFHFESPGQPGLVDAQTTAEGVPADFPTPIIVVCPRDVKPSAGAIYGTGSYTADSPICIAAQHAGVLAPGVGGAVQVTMVDGETTFLGTKANDVTSGKRDGPMAAYRLARASASAAMAPSGTPGAITGLVVRMDANAIATVSWDAVAGATGYVVVRWKVDDASCCNSLSPPGARISGTSWVDTSPLPSHGSYGFRLYATTASATLAGETTIVWNGPLTAVQTLSPTAATTTQLPAPTNSVVTPPRAAGAGPIDRTAPPPSTNSGRYRVSLTGLQATMGTKELPDRPDGWGDEIYVAALAIQWDPRDNRVKSRTLVRTVEYGDIAAALKTPDRIQAGSRSNSGGLKAGDSLPPPVDPKAAAGGTRLPLVVWDGVLEKAADALLIVPSVWERDQAGGRFEAYQAMWLNASLTSTLTSPFVTIQYPSPGLMSIAANIQPGVPIVVALSDVGANLIDRPVGLRPMPLLAPYEDRFIVMTREKLDALTAPGMTTSVAVPFTEPDADPILGGNYTLHLRVERIE
jgi:hypothetical protein